MNPTTKIESEISIKTIPKPSPPGVPEVMACGGYKVQPAPVGPPGTKKLPLVKESDLMSKVLLVITKKSFGCVGVINKSKNLIGIITDGDLRRNMKKDIINKKASEVMTKKPKVVEVNTLVGEAINIMNVKKITSLFVCAHSKPVGIVHIHDLLRLSS